MNESAEFKRYTRNALANSKQKAKRWGAESTLTLEEIREVLGGAHCIYCDEETPLESRALSYIVPLHEAGDNASVNVLMACKPCVKKIGWNAVFYSLEDSV